MEGAQAILTTVPRPSQHGKSQEILCQTGQKQMEMQRSEHCWVQRMGHAAQ